MKEREKERKKERKEERKEERKKERKKEKGKRQKERVKKKRITMQTHHIYTYYTICMHVYVYTLYVYRCIR